MLNVSISVDVPEDATLGDVFRAIRRSLEKSGDTPIPAYGTAVKDVVVRSRQAVTAKRSSVSDVREWALAQGYAVGTRGRFSSEVLNAYGKAHA